MKRSGSSQLIHEHGGRTVLVSNFTSRCAATPDYEGVKRLVGVLHTSSSPADVWVHPPSHEKPKARLALWYARCMTTQVAVRLPDELICRLDALVPTTHPSRSEAVRRAIECYLYRLAREHDAPQYERLPLTDAELSLADDPDARSDAPPHAQTKATVKSAEL